MESVFILIIGCGKYFSPRISPWEYWSLSSSIAWCDLIILKAKAKAKVKEAITASFL
ncbi:MAG: hypothetical protein ACJAYB_002492 [Psychromonas sp.]|jgi:hypothetical protein